MKVNGLSIEVQAKLTITDETAERCLRMIEMWQRDNPDKIIRGEEKRTERGIETKYEIVRRTEF